MRFAQPKILSFIASSLTLRARIVGVRSIHVEPGSPRPRPAGLLRAGSDEPQRHRPLPAGARTARADAPPVLGDARAVGAQPADRAEHRRRPLPRTAHPDPPAQAAGG